VKREKGTKVEGALLVIVILLLLAAMAITIKCSGRKSRHGYGMVTTIHLYAERTSAANGKYVHQGKKYNNNDHRTPVEPVVLLDITCRITPGAMLIQRA